MSAKLLLFDLDETLAPDEAVDAALVAELAAEYGVDAAALAPALVEAADQLWKRGQAADYCVRIGISSLEGLWGPFAPSEDPMLAFLHTFVPGYRLRVWETALGRCGVGDAGVAAEVAARFAHERRARQAAYPWSRDVLQQLRGRHRLGMITNGAPDLQRLKLAGAGLAGFFDPLIVSGDLGVGKPEPAIFAHALERARATPEEAVMIGDSWQRDVLGALGAGIPAIWLTPRAAPPPAMPPGSPAVLTGRDLRALPGLLERL
jgi:putative hydrolase of the HAD superfamily